MKKHINYSKIGQFRNVITSINRKTRFVGLDESGEPIYDHSIKTPKIRFYGTVKLHGTNGGVSYNLKEGFWAQSSNGIITPEKDNAGFAFFAHSRREPFIELVDQIADENEINLKDNTITIFGEWAGKRIQKGVGISEIEKAFFIFGVKVSPFSEEETSYWLDSKGLAIPILRIYNIEDFPTYSIDVDFNMPELSQNILGELTQEVEKECPVAKAFGITGVGEGIVWKCKYKGDQHIFKVKGEKHSVSKVKKLASVDVEKLESIMEFVDYAVTVNRYNQAIENVVGEQEKDITQVGNIIRWMIGDIIKEETDTLTENGLEPKDVNKLISVKTREMFFEDLKF